MSREGTGRNGPDPKISDPEWVAAFVSEVEQGARPYLASEVFGVSRITLYKWLHLGGYYAYADHSEWVHPDVAKSPYKEFAEATLQAEARAHLDITRTVHNKVANGGDLNAAIKYLRTRYADDYVRPQTQVLVNEHENTVTLSLDSFRQMQREATGDSET